MRIAFCHHLSLSRFWGGGEKWIIEVATELIHRGHEVKIYCLPFTIPGGIKNGKKINIPYHESYFHKVIDFDVTYVTYHPLSGINFKINGPKIGGMHSACFWSPLSWKNGLLINLATVVNALISKYELAKFDAIHRILDVYPVNHPNVKDIPNFVDSTKFQVTQPKNDDFTVGFCSRKTFTKGYDIWLKIKKQLGDEMNFIESGNIPENEMANFYSKCHVIVVPARFETFGLTIVESLLCGTNVLSSRHLVHRALGLPLNYANTIPTYIDALIELRSGNKKSNTRLRRTALKYDKSIIIDQIENMFEEVAK